jgi:RND family efflux transporter MFP subunit
MFKKSLIWLILFGAIVSVAYYFLYGRNTLSLAVVSPHKGPAVAAVYANGTVESKMSAVLSPTILARLEKFHKDEGDKVKKGEIVVAFDDGKISADMAALSAQLKFLENDVQRHRTLVEKNYTTQAKYDQKVSERDRLAAMLRSAKERQEEYILRSPMDGEVIKREREEGEVIKAGTELVWIGQLDNLRIEAEVDEEDIPTVQPGQKVLIKSDAFPDQNFDGLVDEITPLGDAINKNYRVYIDLPKTIPLLAGMTVEVNIITQARDDALLVPTSAVQNSHVWVVDASRAKRQNVNVGIRGNKYTEILSGIAGNAVVISMPPKLLVEGQKVSPQVASK